MNLRSKLMNGDNMVSERFLLAAVGFFVLPQGKKVIGRMKSPFQALERPYQGLERRFQSLERKISGAGNDFSVGQTHFALRRSLLKRRECSVVFESCWRCVRTAFERKKPSWSLSKGMRASFVCGSGTAADGRPESSGLVFPISCSCP